MSIQAETLQSALAAEEDAPALTVTPPWISSVLVLFTFLFVSTLLLSVFGRVEITSRGRGVVRPTGGIRPLAAPIGGVVAELYVHSGETVVRGNPIVRLTSMRSQAELGEAERELALAMAELQQARSADATWSRSELRQAASQVMSMREQVASLGRSSVLAEEKLSSNLKLSGAGLLSEIDVVNARDAVEQAQRQLAAARQALAAAEQSLASLSRDRQKRLADAEQKFRTAEIRRDTVAASQQDAVIRAPASGLVEALVFRPGDIVADGEQLGKLIRNDAPVEVIAFLPEKDRSFVKNSDCVRLELDQYPYGELGTREAIVARIGDDPASESEVREAFGRDLKLDTPVYRVELRLRDRGASGAHLAVRSGMLLNARFVLRRQAPITIVFEPLRRWFS